MSRLKKIIKWIINILTVILIIILVFVIYGKLSLTFTKNKYPNYFGYTLFEVASGSMQPTLNVNDVVLVRISNKDLKIGDIIAFVSEDAIITHKIIYMDNDTITVKGDSNNVVDKPIKTDQVIGKVIKIYPQMGVWKKVLLDPKVLVGIFVTLLLFDYALSKKGNDKKRKPKKKNKKVDEILHVEKIELNKNEERKDITDSEKLLEITRKINIEDINKLMEGTKLELSKEEVDNVQKEVDNITEDDNIDTISKNLSDKEKEFLDWTIRLDLNEIQRRIDEKIR